MGVYLDVDLKFFTAFLLSVAYNLFFSVVDPDPPPVGGSGYVHQNHETGSSMDPSST